MNLAEIVKHRCKKSIQECTNQELYYALAEMVKGMAQKKECNGGKKRLYYISAEFLIGKLLSNHLINLGIYDEVNALLEQNGKSLREIEEIEPEPSLGNGGLGRLAACFLDSIATLGLNGAGIGLNYHYGLFRQVFKDNLQYETPNPWIEKESWLTPTDKVYPVLFGGFQLNSRMYDITVTGYGGHTIQLHLFDVETVDEGIVKEGISFDKEDIAKNLTLFLYPDDSDEKGHLLRIYQQYFMVSSGARLILEEAVERGSNLHDLSDYAVIQINDTHPTMVIPELIRLLMERGILIDEAIQIVSKTCAYTNHTILAEALETWPLRYLEKAVPQLMPILYELDNRVRQKFTDQSVCIIDAEKRAHMAHIDIHYGYSVNGVAHLHTEILKNTELNSFYKIYPEKFNNKTNGITFRRWLLHCNPQLTDFIEAKIGPGFKKDAMELLKLEAFQNDNAVLKELLQIKIESKKELKDYLKKTQGIEVDETSIFDIQIKRLHEYKRQQMNALYVIHKYFEIKSGKKPTVPITVIFGAKAAPAYVIAKDIIHLILCLQQFINQDPDVSSYLKVVMVENYNVTLAEKLIPAADIHEQISLASKEASGTGNMKFMLNGAVTIGTMDGANVEMLEEVGKENMFIFGMSSDEVIAHERNRDYNPMQIFNNDQDIRKVLMQLINGFYSPQNSELFRELYNSLLNTQSTRYADTYFILADFNSYAQAQKEVEEAYKDQKRWAKMAILNTAYAGKFSSDRTIQEYVDDIWHLEKLDVEEGVI